MFRSGDYACIELHRELVSEKLTTVLPLNDAWHESTEVCERGLRYRTLSPTHALILSFLHSQIIDRRDETFAIGLRSIQDLLALDAAFGPSIDWGGIQSRLRAHGLHGDFRIMCSPQRVRRASRRRAACTSGYRSSFTTGLHRRGFDGGVWKTPWRNRFRSSFLEGGKKWQILLRWKKAGVNS